MRYSYRYRSFFWPGLLILAGVIALLVNTGKISTDRLGELFNLWPLILIVVGLELIIRRSAPGRSGDVATALIALVAVVGAVVYVVVAPNPSATGALDLSQPVGNLQSASLETDVGAATVTIETGSATNGDLFHAHIEYSGPKPSVNLDRSSGKVTISQSNNGFNFFASRRFVMTVDLNPAVHWSITTNSGAATETFKLAGLQVGAISINTGASREDLTLGVPSGIVPVSVDGGALTVNVHRPSGTEASVTVSGGAVSLNGDGHQMHAVGDLSYKSSGFDQASDAYRVQVNGGACTVSVDTVPAAT